MNPVLDEPAEVKIARVYEAITAERAARQDSKAISARDLALRAKMRRSTSSEWLKQREALQFVPVAKICAPPVTRRKKAPDPGGVSARDQSLQ